MALLAAAGLFAPVAEAKSKKAQADEVIEPCPVDNTLRTADPKLLERFRALAGCKDQVLYAPASQLDYVEADGRIIVAEGRADSDDVDAEEDGEEGEYSLQYADIKPGMSSKDHKVADPTRKGAKGNPNRQDSNLNDEKGASVEIYAYDSRSSPKSLAGTGTVVRIVPAAEPEMPASAFAPGLSDGGTNFASGGAPSSGILAMRPQSYRTRFDGIIAQTANTHRIDPLLLHAVIQQESGYRHTIRSHAGAQGLMQIMPGTGRMLGVQPAHLNDPATNVDAGARLLRRLYFKYSGNFDLILAAYNAGEGAVQKYGNRVPPYRETQNYVKMVMQRYNRLLAEQNGVAVQQ